MNNFLKGGSWILLIFGLLLVTPTSANTTPELYEWEQQRPIQQVLRRQDHEALRLSHNAAQAERYPVQDGDRTLHLYGSGQPTMICALLKICTIELQAGEVVSKNGITLGDPVRWQVSPSVGEGGKTFLMVKPAGVNLETNLVIVTDKHHYDVKLVSTHNARISKIAWTYPKDTAKAWADYHANQQSYEQQVKHVQSVVKKRETLPGTRATLSQLDFSYGLTGCDECHWRPVRVYNDGRQTVVEFPDLTGQEAPALLVVSNQGDRIVNYRVQGNRYLVDSLFDKAVLLLGVGETQQRITVSRIQQTGAAQ